MTESKSWYYVWENSGVEGTLAICMSLRVARIRLLARLVEEMEGEALIWRGRHATQEEHDEQLRNILGAIDYLLQHAEEWEIPDGYGGSWTLWRIDPLDVVTAEPVPNGERVW